MVAQTLTPPIVGQLLQQAEQLRPSEFEQFLASVLALNARRKFNGLPAEEALLLKKINKEFSAKKMARFLSLDENRRQGIFTPEEHKEFLNLVRQLEKYDAQKMKWIGELALLRKVSLDSLLKQLGLYQVQHG